jgi:ribosomal protein L16 Arg81 hydroxylase
MDMEMNENEIVKNYRESKNKKQQIDILADMNCCSPEQIKEILKKNGVDLRGGNYRAKKEETPKEDAKAASPVPERKIEIPEEQIVKNKLPRIVRKTLEEDLDFIEEQLKELIEKKITIKKFLEDN